MDVSRAPVSFPANNNLNVLLPESRLECCTEENVIEREGRLNVSRGQRDNEPFSFMWQHIYRYLVIGDGVCGMRNDVLKVKGFDIGSFAIDIRLGNSFADNG